MEGDYNVSLQVMTAVLTFLCTGAVALRIYARRLRKASLGWDDYTVIAALIFTWGYATVMFVGTSDRGSVGKHSPLDPETTLPILNRQLKTLLQSSWATLLIASFSLGLTKISVILLYRRIFSSSAQNLYFSIATWGLIAFTVMWIITFFFAILFQCVPFHTNWDTYGGTDATCYFPNPVYEAQGWTDSITDLFILIIPIPCVWGLMMPLRQKIAVTIMFLLGGLTFAVSCVKLYFWYWTFNRLEAYDTDLGWVISPSIYWPMIESALAIIGACLPLYKPIFDDCVPVVRLTSYIRDLTTGSNSRGSGRGLFSTGESGKSNLTGKGDVTKSSTITHETVTIDSEKPLQ